MRICVPCLSLVVITISGTADIQRISIFAELLLGELLKYMIPDCLRNTAETGTRYGSDVRSALTKQQFSHSFQVHPPQGYDLTPATELRWIEAGNVKSKSPRTFSKCGI